MAELVDCYVTLEEIKTRLGGDEVDDGDTQLAGAITSACRALDDHCLQTFTKATAATARIYTPDGCSSVYVDPFYETAALVIKTDSADVGTYTTTWAATDYDLDFFAGDWGQSIGAPYDTIHAVGSYTFPARNRRRRSVQVTAKWGWSAPPQQIVEAARILSVDLWKRKDTPFGVMTGGGTDFGGLRIGRDIFGSVTTLVQRLVRTDRGGIG